MLAACSICSADFNDWIGKNASLAFKGSYVFTGEWEMQDWNLGNVRRQHDLQVH